MLNPSFYDWLQSLTDVPAFQQAIAITPDQRSEQQHVEIALRFVAYRKCPYVRGLDVNEYLDFAARQLSAMTDKDRASERELLDWTLSLLVNDVDAGVFKRWNGAQFSGKFLISGFDAIAYGGAREDSTRIGSGGVVRRQAVDVSPLRRVNQAISLMTKGSRTSAFRSLKSISETLAEEIIATHKTTGQTTSYAIRKKEEIERVSKGNR